MTIHRWTADTLRVLLADHLDPTLARLDGELDDLRAARDGADKKAAREAEQRYAKVQKWREELGDVHRRRRAVRRAGPAADRRQLPAARGRTPATPPTSTTA